MPKNRGEKKIEKLFLAQICLKQINSQFSDYTKIIDSFEKSFLAQICLKQIMSQFLDYTKKMAKNQGKK